MPEFHSAAIECKTRCPRCGGVLFLNGPLLKVHCNNCQSEVDVSEALWGSIISSILEDFSGFGEGDGRNSIMFTEGFQIELLYGRLRARCPKCKTNFPEPLTPPETRCPNCDYRARVLDAPDWFLREARKRLSELAESIAEEKGKRPALEIGPIMIVDAECPGNESDAVLSEPVVFSCPKCGGALDIDGRERIVPCKYCGSKLYIPDDLWFRIHPAKTVKRWFMVFAGKLPSVK
ncbi:MAG: hypothetical protein ABIM74_07095 [candidate division WOR-3 bacterium]